MPEHEVRAVRCGEVVRRSVVGGEMSVCEGCRGAVEAMRSMVERWVDFYFHFLFFVLGFRAWWIADGGMLFVWCVESGMCRGRRFATVKT